MITFTFSKIKESIGRFGSLTVLNSREGDLPQILCLIFPPALSLSLSFILSLSQLLTHDTYQQMPQTSLPRAQSRTPCRGHRFRVL
jgi:hypothetical protein